MMLHMQVGQTIRLKGISRHGKNRIHEAKGDTWRISKIRREVSFKTTAPGPFMLLQSTGGTDSRWVSKINDPNFEVVEVVDE
jgi:hypothetical protein|tara:strand:+ start:1028 stop:1273 length:246 start_codon:yes stop_codon:yes gene_type:complete